MYPYVEQYLAQPGEREALLAHFGAAYAQLVRFLYRELDRGSLAAYMALQCRQDLERGTSYVTGAEQGYYLLQWGWIVQRLVDRHHGLALTEQALKIAQELEDEELKLQVFNNIAQVYAGIGQPQQALEYFEQALPIRRAAGDRAGEAATLNNIASVYAGIGQPQQALEYHEQALLISREVGDRAGEAAILNNQGYLYQSLQRYQEAMAAFEQSIALERQVIHPAGEAAGLAGLALLLFRHLNRPQEAITHLEQAIAVLRETGLPQDAAGNTTGDLQSILQAMHTGVPLEGQAGGSSTMPTEQIQQIISNTVAVMTTVQDRRAEWRKVIVGALQKAQNINRPQEAELFVAIIDILDGRAPGLPADHPYAQTVTAIQAGIAAGGPQVVEISEEVVQAIRDFVNAESWETKRQVVEAQQSLLFRPEIEAIFEENIEQAKGAGEEQEVNMLELHLAILRNCKTQGIADTFEQLAAAQQATLPFDAELVPLSIAALLGDAQEKMTHVQYLTTLAARTTDEELKALINTIQLALFGGDLAQLGQDLNGIYRQTWEAIVAGVEQGGMSG